MAPASSPFRPHGGAFQIALVQTASTLPFFLFALPAGALGDIVDRRRLILVTEYWMLAAAVVLAAVTLSGMMTPWLLLVLTFLLAAGDAWEQPSWRALLPELATADDLPAANALNGIEFNLARALGPALAGLLIAVAGVGSAFVLNALSFLGVIFVIARWKRPPSPTTGPREQLAGATVAALRYVRHSPGIRTLILRAVGEMFFSAAILALLPVVASRLSTNPLGYGALLGIHDCRVALLDRGARPLPSGAGGARKFMVPISPLVRRRWQVCGSSRTVLTSQNSQQSANDATLCGVSVFS